MKIDRFEDIIACQKAKKLTYLSYKEFKYFLFVPKGSWREVRLMFHLAKDLKKLSEQSFNEKYKLSEENSKIPLGLIKTL